MSAAGAAFFVGLNWKMYGMIASNYSREAFHEDSSSSGQEEYDISGTRTQTEHMRTTESDLYFTQKSLFFRETHESHSFCPISLMKAGSEALSTSHVWHNLQQDILNASYHALPRIETLNTTQLHAYKDWVDQIFSFYTPSKLRRSIMNPAPSKQIIQLMKLAEEIRHHNANVSDEKDNEEKRKLRILILGGSVTAGMNCAWPDNLNFPKQKRWSIPGEECAWSFRLEKLLNHVLFEGEEVVTVDNISAGGQTSEFGSYVLEYRLYPKPDQLPDVVIASFSANESQESDLQKVLYQFNQDFVKAAQSLHPCDDQAPLIMFVDDFYGDRPYTATVQSGNMFMLSTWHNIMAVNYASTVKYKLFGEVEDEGARKTKPRIPLFHSDYQIHLGIGMHMGLAWTVMFNIVNSMVNVCNDVGISRMMNDRSHGSSLMHLAEGEEDAVPAIGLEAGVEEQAKTRELGVPQDTSSSSIRSSSMHETKNAEDEASYQHHEEEEVDSYPPIDPNLLPNLKTAEIPFKHIDRMVPDVPGTALEVRKKLEDNIQRTKATCDKLEKMAANNNINSTNKKCSYAWVVNKMIGFGHKNQVASEMSKVLLSNDGWAAEGYVMKNPRAGWYTHRPNSTFSIMIKDTVVDTNFVVILSMKSYSEKWQGSKLAVSTFVVKKNETATATATATGTSAATTSDHLMNEKEDSTVDLLVHNKNNEDGSGDHSNSTTFFIDGFHDIKTSVHFPHKIPIAGGGAKAGDSVILKAKLVGGQEFKIAGFAFCSF